MTPAQRVQATTLRAAGYTLASIASETGISVRTLSRHLAGCPAKSKSITDEMVRRAREKMLESIDDSERVREALAASVLDDLALTRAIREKIVSAVDVIDVSNSDRAREGARALAQLAAAVKSTQAVGRTAFGENSCDSPAKPTMLEIREMFPEEIDEIRAAQRRAAQSDVNDGHHEHEVRCSLEVS